MSYVAPIHRPSSIRHALRLRLTEDEESLVVSRSNRLEVWRVTPTDMFMLGSVSIYGTVLLLQRLTPKDSKTDLLFVGTDRFQYFTARWDSDLQRLVTEQVIEDSGEPHMREAQSQDKCLVDPSGRFMAMHLWEGVMNVMRLGARAPNASRLDPLWEQVRLSELSMKASTFVPTETGHPTIAFLYQSKIDKEDARLAIYRLMSDDRNTKTSNFDAEKDRELDMEILDPYARILIPVSVEEDQVKRYHKRDTSAAKAQLGGLIVVGETLLVYVDTLTKTKVSAGIDNPTIFVAYAEYDVRNYFLSDDYGNLQLLTIDTDGVVVTGLRVTHLGLTSRASCLVYMGDGMLFLGSHYGDSQLLKVDVTAGSETTQIVQIIPNIAPILDFAIMDLGNAGDSQVGNAFSSGQARIVAGCGVHQNGSLRSIRSSVGLEDIGVLEDLSDVRGLFSLRSIGSDKDDTLVVSFITDTRVFRFDAEEGIEEVFQFQGLELDKPTLIASTLPNGQLLQVTANSAALLDPEGGITLSTWSAPEGKVIVNASSNAKWVLLSIDGTTLVSLSLLENLAAREQVLGSGVGGKGDQISCIHAATDLDNIGVVGFWATGSISIIDLETLDALHGETIKQTDDSVSVPRNIALVQLHPPHLLGPTLFVSLEDGQVVSFDVSKDNYSLSGRKSVILGSKQAGLHILPRPDSDGISNVFATTEHSSLIYSSEGRIIYSAATAEDVTYIAPFDSEAFPDAIVLATDKNVRIAHIDVERRTHVNPLPLRQTVRRVAYSPALKAFGIGTIRRELFNNEEMVTSSFQLVDEIVLGVVGKPFHLDGAATTELVESVIRAELPDSSGQPAERFIVGTSYLADPEMDENSEVKGRILVLGVDSDKNPYQIVSHELKGACRSLGVMGDKLVAGLSKTVVVYDYTEESSTSGSLLKLATFRPSTFPVDLDVNGNMIGVADLMQSMTLIEFIPAQDGNKARLVERARHFQYIWATAVCHLEQDLWIEADAQGNLMVLRRNPNAPTEHDRKQMEVISEFHLGEQINKIRPLDVVSGENDPIEPKAFLATVEGSIYVFADIKPEYQSLLLQFQERLAGMIKTLGQADEPGAGLSFMSWRGFRNAKRSADGPFRFVDGELIERFLDLDAGRQEAVVQGLGPTVERMRDLVEELKHDLNANDDQTMHVIEVMISIGIQMLSQLTRVKGALTVKIYPTWQSANGGIATIPHNSITTRATRKGPGLWCPHQPIIKHQFHNVLPQAASPESFRQSSNHSITKKDAHLPKRHPSPIASRNNHQPSPLHPPESLEMAPLAHASRTCLRQLARSSPAATAARALSTSAARNDATATSYSSPFKGAQKGSQIPDFSKYMSKGSAQGNHLISYFMVGTMGAITAAGAKSTVQEFLVNMSASADVLAMAKVEVDLNAIPEGKNVIIKWRGKPVFIRHRTQAEIDEANKVSVASLRDPQADDDRVKQPEWLIMLGVCTHLGCVPIGEAGDYGGWFCPCHGSHYDISGRIRKGPAPLNLEIPEYEFPEEGKLVIG